MCPTAEIIKFGNETIWATTATAPGAGLDRSLSQASMYIVLFTFVLSITQTFQLNSWQDLPSAVFFGTSRR